MTRISKKQKGFTLVELAIVLVVIGLIVSGVLVGQDLIKAAELRSTVRQYQDFQVAVNTFIGKYAGIPGDTDSDKFGFCDGEDDSPSGCSAVATAAAATSGCDGEANLGDGDGKIEDHNGVKALYDGEISCFWSQLTTPGKELIKGVFDGYEAATAAAGVNQVVGENMPQMKFGSRGWGVYTDGTYNYFVTGVPGSSATNAYATADVFVPVEAYNIDIKIDDGVPNAGDLQAVNGAAANPDTQTGADFTNAGVLATACQNTTPNPAEYQFTATTALCNLRFKMQTF
ncbi:MAG: prepilin-type N-terminal cleavage/methylation protein [Rickettsiaceae bacterium]|nr:prepilin-type N-terminal cleavage/methylation protein [Rickettsiaceae bacterium]